MDKMHEGDPCWPDRKLGKLEKVAKKKKEIRVWVARSCPWTPDPDTDTDTDTETDTDTDWQDLNKKLASITNSKLQSLFYRLK